MPLKAFADIGLVFFMFLVGLELNPDLMRKEGRRALQISLSGMVAPLALGVLLATQLVGCQQRRRLPRSRAGATTPTPDLRPLHRRGNVHHRLSGARADARRDGMYKQPIGTAALCAAAVDDACAWILLAGVVGSRAQRLRQLAYPGLLLAAGFVAVMFLVVRPTAGAARETV